MAYSDFVTDFYVNGLVVTQNSEILEMFSEDNYNFIDANEIFTNDFTALENEELNQIQSFIELKYLSNIFKDIQKHSYGRWEGVDNNSKNWHNDYLRDKLYNITCLYYLDDTCEDVGGSLEVKGKDTQTKIFPKRNDLVFLNQSHNFEHRAKPSRNTRRVLSFDYYSSQLVNK